jgi:hypothetical protein
MSANRPQNGHFHGQIMQESSMKERVNQPSKYRSQFLADSKRECRINLAHSAEFSDAFFQNVLQRRMATEPDPTTARKLKSMARNSRKFVVFLATFKVSS